MDIIAAYSRERAGPGAAGILAPPLMSRVDLVRTEDFRHSRRPQGQLRPTCA
ncbi:hypothetical protein K443DRAFT_677593 [Laccaria amethystina LaAM-08-1]|uniref:Uncharacterized protein n=1 Tax=Laccaria amethystina LaAM-08-1 TaxID=1095629 RepID=A0A0C9XBW6_9AGAR|nr:hypothetical protein K443DRAFT_677593 [Laccaria amethystina LaAM-08-1]